MAECGSSDDSDSNSLPDLSVFTKSAPSKIISSGDIVWAKYQKLYWPALVRKVYSKKKKISIWYTHKPGITFKLPLKNICSFDDIEMRGKIEKDASEAGCFKAHQGLTSHALKYLERKAKGYKDDPMKFFDQTYPFFLMEEWRENNPGADESNVKIPPLYISHETSKTILRRKDIDTSKGACDTEEVSSDSSETTEVKPVKTDLVSMVNTQLKHYYSDSAKDEYLNGIVECVLSGRSDEYLRKILLKKVQSEHRDIYYKATKCNNQKINDITYTGPIKDNDKLRELINYLISLYDNTANIRKSNRNVSKKMPTISTFLFQDKSDKAQYVASVWLPESIIYAISEIKNISLSEAKCLFKETSESETKRVQNILSSLDVIQESHMTKSSYIHTKQENHEADKGTTDNACSPLKKICVERFKTVKSNRQIAKDLKSTFVTSKVSDSDIKPDDFTNAVDKDQVASSSGLKCDVVSNGKTSKKVCKRYKV